MPCSLFGKHEVFLTGSQDGNDLAPDAQCVMLKVEYKAMLSHEWSTDDHIISVYVNDVNVGIVFAHWAQLELGPCSKVNHGAATNCPKLQGY
jgi:hypothetical protein